MILRPQLPPGLRELLPTYVAVGVMQVAELADSLPAGEAALIERAVPKRRREFATGRVLARALLGELGISTDAIGQREDRTPLWPAGVVGSISHCHDLSLVAVGRIADGIRSLGVDVEPAEPLPINVRNDVASAAELAFANSGAIAADLALRRLFSAKEAAYKCIYPAVRQILEFHDLSVEFSENYDRFEAHLPTGTASQAGAPKTVAGRQMEWDGWILTATIWEQ
jgi:4'-phosphopantetheinyl transferase EntD